MFDFLKKLLKRYVRNLIVLFLLAYFYPGFYLKPDIPSYTLAALVLLIIQTFLQPLLKVLVLPINIITFGMFNWLLLTLHLLIMTFVVDTAYFQPFIYQEFKFLSINIPGGDINIIFSVIIGSVFYRFLRKIVSVVT